MKKNMFMFLLSLIIFFGLSTKVNAFTDDDTYVKYCNPRKNVYPGDNICVYMSSTSSYSGNYLLYDKSNNEILYYIFNYNEKIIIPNGKKIEISNYGVFNNYESHIDSNVTSCPEYIYLHMYEQSNYTYQHYFSLENEMKKNKIFLTDTLKLYDCKPDEDVIQTTDGCNLFSDKLIEIINSVMSYIRIGVPLILIVLIGVDFAKATFTGDEKEIKKSKDAAIKRIIIAIVIFFVPTLLNLLFNVANSVWADAHYEICGIDNN